ncbi:hypothetical protein [Novosphingobium album (ex Hu et al. 2023)]|uniref:Uncharacterized protein n=1 Tax=Novosphingobium album (ex Hu et al. 2023) TaxID=2930093 RepID=A0ABT0B4J4_9SPHN|nr:hypothetical protein [Novosphingobium album (ex Hu et al. 2023)]MCJ2179744.1 hypothetical protein [Novosphingobium album (ex Hu et al. 2023)]
MKQFLTALQAGLVLFAMALSGTGWASDARVEPGVMTGAYYMRDTLVPRADDLALIQRKPALYLASFNDGMATVAYSLEDGRIVYRVVKGEIGATARAEIDKALSRLQRKLA